MGLNAYYHRPLGTNVLRNAGLSGAVAFVTSGTVMALRTGLATRAAWGVGNTVGAMCVRFPTACTRVEGVLNALDSAEQVGLQVQLAVQTALHDPRAAETALELQLEYMDGGLPGNTFVREAADELPEIATRYGDEAAQRLSLLSDDVVATAYALTRRREREAEHEAELQRKREQAAEWAAKATALKERVEANKRGIQAGVAALAAATVEAARRVWDRRIERLEERVEEEARQQRERAAAEAARQREAEEQRRAEEAERATALAQAQRLRQIAEGREESPGATNHATATPTPTASPSATSPYLTPTLSATPTVGPTVTATPSSTASATPEATATRTPSATPVPQATYPTSTPPNPDQTLHVGVDDAVRLVGELADEYDLLSGEPPAYYPLELTDPLESIPEVAPHLPAIKLILHVVSTLGHLLERIRGLDPLYPLPYPVPRGEEGTGGQPSRDSPPDDGPHNLGPASGSPPDGAS